MSELDHYKTVLNEVAETARYQALLKLVEAIVAAENAVKAATQKFEAAETCEDWEVQGYNVAHDQATITFRLPSGTIIQQPVKI